MRKYNLKTQGIAFYHDKIYFSAQEFNGLFCADQQGGEALFLSKFPDLGNNKQCLHSDVLQFEEELLFLPDLSDYITLYNIRTKNFVNFKYPIISKGAFRTYPKVATGIVVEQCAYCFGEQDPCIIKFDFVTHKIKVYDDWFQKYKKFGYREGMTCFCKDIGIIGKSIYAKTHHNGVILEFNTVTEEISFHCCSELLSSVLCCDNDNVWYFGEEGQNISCWNVVENTTRIIEFGKELQSVKKVYERSAVTNSEIWLFPYWIELPVLVLDKKNEVFSKRTFGVTENLSNVPAYALFRKYYNGCLYFMPITNSRLYCIDGETGKEIYSTDIYIDKDNYLDQLCYKTENVICEQKGFWSGAEFTLEEYLYLLNNKILKEGWAIHGRFGYGYEIMKKIKQELEEM